MRSGRYQMPVSIVGLRPQRHVAEPSSYWDFGLIWEYCPDAEVCVIGDSDEFTMLDVAIAPLLWRLDHYGIKLGKSAAPLMKYAERIFSRPAFIEALTPSEKVMRK